MSDSIREKLWELFKNMPKNDDSRGTVNHFFDLLIPFIEQEKRQYVRQVLPEKKESAYYFGKCTACGLMIENCGCDDFNEAIEQTLTNMEASKPID